MLISFYRLNFAWEDCERMKNASQTLPNTKTRKKYIISTKYLCKKIKGLTKLRDEIFRPRCIITIGIVIRFKKLFCNTIRLRKIGCKQGERYKKTIQRRSNLKTLVKNYLETINNSERNEKIENKSATISQSNKSAVIEIVDSEDEQPADGIKEFTKDLEEFESGLQKDTRNGKYNKSQNASIVLIDLDSDENEENVKNIECEKNKNEVEVAKEDTSTRIEKDVGTKSFIDSLLNKIKSNSRDDIVSSKTNSKTMKISNIPNESVNESNENILDILAKSNHDSDVSDGSITEFHGFHSEEVGFDDLKNNPKDPSSAFVSEKLDKFMKANLLEDCSNVTIPVRKFEYDSNMPSEFELPIQLECPEYISNRKFRTVAEKRESLEKKKSIKCLMIESESTIYWEHKRRQKDKDLCNYELIHDVQDLKIPFRRGTWKTASWLATEKGQFYFLSIHLDSEKILNFYGGKGNFPKKTLELSLVKPKILTDNMCSSSCKIFHNYPTIKINKSIKLNQILSILSKKRHFGDGSSDSEKSLSPPKKMKKTIVRSKAGPLSSKTNDIDKEDILVSSLDIYEMPKIQLEVWPRKNFEFENTIKSYLKYVQPSDFITEEWAKFASSTVVEPNAETSKEKTKRSFIFDIPYTNNQQKILVRKMKSRYNSLDKNVDYRKEIRALKEPLKILDNINNDNEISNDISSYLKDMFASVAISVCGDAIVKRDPDIDYKMKDNDINAKGDAKDKLLSQVFREKKTIDKHKIRVL